MDWSRLMEAVNTAPGTPETAAMMCAVLAAVEQVGAERLTPIKEVVGDEVS